MSENLSSSSKFVSEPLSDVLGLLRPSSYAFRGLNAGGDWSLAHPANDGIVCIALKSGSCWLSGEVAPNPIKLVDGDVLLLATPKAFVLGSAPNIASLDVSQVMDPVPMGTFAQMGDGSSCSGVGGYFDFDGPAATRLLALLPPVIHVHANVDKLSLRHSIERLMRELAEPRPGTALVASHISQMLLVEALRLQMHAPEQRGWLFAMADRRMRLAMNAIHAEPGRKWTLTELAQQAGMSRSAFAAHFTDSLGESPMNYLTCWRMMLATSRLSRNGESISKVAQDLGYQSDSSFTAAFKRVMGMPPGQYIKAQSVEQKVRNTNPP